MKKGLWTICLHPSEMNPEGFRVLNDFIQNRLGSFPNPFEAVNRAVPYGLGDAIFEAALAAALRVRHLVMRTTRKAQ
jgi:hypothetical protein